MLWDQLRIAYNIGPDLQNIHSVTLNKDLSLFRYLVKFSVPRSFEHIFPGMQSDDTAQYPLY